MTKNDRMDHWQARFVAARESEHGLFRAFRGDPAAIERQFMLASTVLRTIPRPTPDDDPERNVMLFASMLAHPDWEHDPGEGVWFGPAMMDVTAHFAGLDDAYERACREGKRSLAFMLCEYGASHADHSHVRNEAGERDTDFDDAWLDVQVKKWTARGIEVAGTLLGKARDGVDCNDPAPFDIVRRQEPYRKIWDAACERFHNGEDEVLAFDPEIDQAQADETTDADMAATERRARARRDAGR